MSKSLRSKLIRLAYEKPELREQILPLVTGKKVAFDDLTSTANAVAALTFASGELLDLGMETEATLITKIKMKVLKMDPSMRSEAAAIAREMYNRYGKTASTKTAAGFPLLKSMGLDQRAARAGKGAMLYFIDAARNHSKFYEMLVVPEGEGFKLMRRWGALTDSGATGRVDRKDQYFEGLRGEILAMRELAKIYKKKTRKGYVDAFRHDLAKGQYPVGLTRDVGFGWGVQSEAFCIPALRTMASHLDKAQRALDRLQFYDASEALNAAAALAADELADVDSGMAQKVIANIEHMQGRASALLAGEIDRKAIRNWNTALSRLISYLDKQLSVCH